MDQAVDLPAVGAALVFFITAPTMAPIAFCCLRGSCATASGVGGDIARDDRLQLTGVGDLGEALALDDRAGSPPLVTSVSRDGLAAAVGDLLLLDQADQRGEALGETFEKRQRSRPPPSWRSAAASSPVTQ